MSELSDELREEARWHDRIAAELERLEEERDAAVAEVERLRDATHDHYADLRADLEAEMRSMRRVGVVGMLVAGMLVAAFAVVVTLATAAITADATDPDTTTTIDTGQA